MTTALSIYLGALLFGSVLILTSLIFGGDDGDMDKDVEFDKDISFDKDVSFDKDIDFDKDVDFDGDPGGEADGPAWLPFLSLRFWTFALGSFGLTGTILTFLGTEAVTTATVSSIMGLVLGYCIALAFQKLKKSNITVDTSSVSLKNQVGSVLLDIDPNSKGKIRVHASNQIHDLMAITQDTKPIRAGEKIIIVSVQDGVANVTTLSNHKKPRAQKEIE